MEEAVEEMIFSQEEEPRTHLSPRNIANHLEISHSSVRNIIKRKEINQFKRVKTPQMNDATRGRQVECAASLADKFKTSPRMSEHAVFQDESVLKVWKNYRDHLKLKLFPAINRVHPKENWILIQDGASSHTSNLNQDFLKETIPRRFVKKDEWPSKSSDSNPLDYFFWDRVQAEVYKGRLNNPFKSEEGMIRKITSVWNKCASDLTPICKAMKQFTSRLQAVKKCNGSSIKKHFG